MFNIVNLNSGETLVTAETLVETLLQWRNLTDKPVCGRF